MPRSRLTTGSRAPSRAQPLELLESRRLLCSLPLAASGITEAPQYQRPAILGGPEVDTGGIVWSNRGTTDNFAAAYGTQADAARQVVDAAFYFWNQVIGSFNQTGGNSQIDIAVTAQARGTGQGGSGGVVTLLGNKPRTSSISLGGGSDRNANGTVEDGEGFYIDPTPYDYSEFQGTIINAATGDATPGSAAATSGNDLFSLVTIEIQHALGIDDRFSNLAWNQDPNDYLRPAGTTHATAVNDGADTPGKLYYLNAPGIRALFTSNNGGAGGQDRGYAVHTARPSQSYTTGGVTYTGQTDTGTTGYPAGRRYLPSYVAVKTFEVMYGYTVNPPQDVSQTFYAVPDRANRRVLVRNTDPASSDLMQVRSGSGFFFIDIDIGNDVAGTNLDGVFVCQFNKLAFDTVIADGGGGTDFMRLESNDGSPVTLRGGDGDDFIDFSFLARNLNNITANAVVAGGAGFDRLFVYDNNQPAVTAFTLTSARFDRPGWGGLSYASDIENETVITGAGNDFVSIPSTFANQPIVVASAGGADTVTIGNASNGVRSIASDVQVQNDPNFTTLNINNGPDTVARTATINQFGGGFGVLSGLAPANIFWDNADIQNITVTTGIAADTLSVLRCSERLFLKNANGVDNITLGNPTTGMAEVTGAVDVVKQVDFVFPNLTIDDAAGTANRNYTWTASSSGYIVGGLPAAVYYDFAATLHVNGGSGNDNFTLTNVADTDIRLHGNGGFDTAGIDDRTSIFPFTQSTMTADAISRVALGSNLSTSFDGLESLTYFANAGAVQTFVYGVPSSIPPGQQATIVLGNNADSVNLYPHDAAGNLTINGNLGIVGNGGADILRVQDAASNAAINYSFSNPFGPGTQNLFGMGVGGFGTATIETWEVYGGNGDDTFAMNQLTSGIALGIDAGGGDDTLQFGNNGLGAITNLASFNFSGGAGSDVFNLNNQAHAGTWTYTRNATSILATSSAGASYFLSDFNTELMRLNGGPSGETFNINIVAPGSAVEVNGAAGVDVLRLGPASNTVQAIRGRVSYDAGADGGSAVVFDTADTTGDTFHLDQTTLGAFPGDDLFGEGGFLAFAGLTDVSAVVPALTVHCGSGSDTAYAQPLASGTATINLNGQNFAGGRGIIGDAINLALAAAANYVITGTGSGNVVSSTTGRLNWHGAELPVQVDDVAPTIVAFDFALDVPAMEIRHTFDEALAGNFGLGFMELLDVDTGVAIPFADMSVAYDPGTFTVIHTFPGLTNGVLPDGNYRARFNPGVADLFGNGSVGVRDDDLFFLAGDADRDRTVGLSDFAILAANFNAGTVFSQGDFDYSGLADIGDFALLAGKFNSTLLPPDAAAARMPRAAAAGMFGREVSRERVNAEILGAA